MSADMSLIGYSAEKISDGFGVLITHPGLVRERLLAAWSGGLYGVGAGLPPELLERWKRVVEECTRIQPTGDEGHYAATINQMQETDAIRIVNEIYSIGSEVQFLARR